MANLSAQRNLDSAQASQQMADKGIVNNLQLTGDANGSKAPQSSESNDNAANSNRERYFESNPWVPNNGGATSDTNVQSVGSTQGDYDDRNPESAKNGLKSFGSVTSDTNEQIHGSNEKSSNDFNPESKSKDGSKFENPGQSENKGKSNPENQINGNASSKAEHSEPVKSGNNPRQHNHQPAPRHQPGPVQRPAPVGRPTW